MLRKRELRHFPTLNKYLRRMRLPSPSASRSPTFGGSGVGFRRTVDQRKPSNRIPRMSTEHPPPQPAFTESEATTNVSPAANKIAGLIHVVREMLYSRSLGTQAFPFMWSVITCARAECGRSLHILPRPRGRNSQVPLATSCRPIRLQIGPWNAISTYVTSLSER